MHSYSHNWWSRRPHCLIQLQPHIHFLIHYDLCIVYKIKDFINLFLWSSNETLAQSTRTAHLNTIYSKITHLFSLNLFSSLSLIQSSHQLSYYFHSSSFSSMESILNSSARFVKTVDNHNAKSNAVQAFNISCSDQLRKNKKKCPDFIDNIKRSLNNIKRRLNKYAVSNHKVVVSNDYIPGDLVFSILSKLDLKS